MHTFARLLQGNCLPECRKLQPKSPVCRVTFTELQIDLQKQQKTNQHVETTLTLDMQLLHAYKVQSASFAMVHKCKLMQCSQLTICTADKMPQW